MLERQLFPDLKSRRRLPFDVVNGLFLRGFQRIQLTQLLTCKNVII